MPKSPKPIRIRASDTVPVSESSGAVVRVANTIQAPSRWVSNHLLPASLRWIAAFDWAGPLLFGIGVMIQVEEYLIADACFLVAAIIALARLTTWQGRRDLKTLGAIAILAGVAFLFVWTDARRDDHAWSNLTKKRAKGEPDKPIVPQLIVAETLTASSDRNMLLLRVRNDGPVLTAAQARTMWVRSEDGQDHKDYFPRDLGWIDVSPLMATGDETKFAVAHVERVRKILKLQFLGGGNPRWVSMDTANGKPLSAVFCVRVFVSGTPWVQERTFRATADSKAPLGLRIETISQPTLGAQSSGSAK